MFPGRSKESTEDLLNALRKHRPRALVAPVLVAINIMVFVLMVATGVDFMEPSIEDLISWGANFGPRTVDWEWWRLLSCTFLHIGALHIAFNMYVLWDVGRVVERLVGSTTFLVLYVASGLVGSLASLALNPQVVSAGASGSVFGVFGALIGFAALQRDKASIPGIGGGSTRHSEGIQQLGAWANPRRGGD